MQFAMLAKAIPARTLASSALVSLAAALVATASLAADLPGYARNGAANGRAGWDAQSAWNGDTRIPARPRCTLDMIQPEYGPLVPTNSPCDPTYVGSTYGLSRPSYYGTMQPPAANLLYR